VAVIDEKVGASSQRINEQVQIPVAIDIDERRAGSIEVRATNTCLVSDILEFPIAQVAKKPVSALESAEVEITQAVPIHIPRSDARTAGKDLAAQASFFGECVGKKDSGRFRRQQGKTIFSCTGRFDFQPAVAGSFFQEAALLAATNQTRRSATTIQKEQILPGDPANLDMFSWERQRLADEVAAV
jgi:hypothetical protein